MLLKGWEGIQAMGEASGSLTQLKRQAAIMPAELGHISSQQVWAVAL